MTVYPTLDISFVENHYLPQTPNIQKAKKAKRKKKATFENEKFFTCGKHRLAQNTIYQQAKKENGRNKSL